MKCLASIETINICWLNEWVCLIHNNGYSLEVPMSCLFASWLHCTPEFQHNWVAFKGQGVSPPTCGKVRQDVGVCPFYIDVLFSNSRSVKPFRNKHKVSYSKSLILWRKAEAPKNVVVEYLKTESYCKYIGRFQY